MSYRTRPEHDHERGMVCPFYSGLGLDVYPTSARVWAKGVRKGVPDLICFWERLGFQFFHETKRPKGGVYSDDQLKFAALCREAGIAVIGGGLSEARSQLERLNLREE